MRAGRRARTAVLLAVVLTGALASSCAHRPAARPADPPTACVARRGATLLDVDPGDRPEKPWRRDGDAKARVVFETSGLPVRYRHMVVRGAELWSASPCIDAVTAPRCAAGDHCVHVVERRADGEDSDGEFASHDGPRYRREGTITLYTDVLGTEGDEEALVTVVHEMGHALGLRHRRDPGSVMHPDSGAGTSPTPDAVDLTNLVTTYG